jgi:hypothetical protein
VEGDDSDVPEFLNIDRKSLVLSHLQTSLRGLGEKHFDPDGRSPTRYFKILLLSQQFEQALAVLRKASHDYYKQAAPHFAITLDYYGLLRRSNPEKQIRKFPIPSVQRLPSVLSFVCFPAPQCQNLLRASSSLILPIS